MLIWPIMEKPIADKKHLFLDFDGVICNSLDECFASSWMAYSTNRPLSVDLAGRRRFDSYRPFIRRGGDYVILQYCIDRSINLESQDDFDRVLDDLGEERVDKFHESFYESRGALLRDSPDVWFRLNPLYPEIAPFLEAFSRRHWIITTKEASFAHRILKYHGVDWELDRIICSGKERKLDIIARTVDAPALLVEDQIDHLLHNTYERIDVLLATWGYIKTEWLDQDIPLLEPQNIEAALGGFL